MINTRPNRNASWDIAQVNSTWSYAQWLKKVAENGINLQHVPLHFRDQRMCITALENASIALKFIPINLLTYQICHNEVLKNPFAIRYIPNQYYNLELVKLACQLNGKALRLVPENYQTLEVVKIALKSNKLASEYVLDTNKLNQARIEIMNSNGQVSPYAYNRGGWVDNKKSFQSSKTNFLRKRKLSQ